MSKKFRRAVENDTDATFELDLAPMLALMVTLIPIMLLATVFVKVNVVSTALPQAVQSAIEKDRKKKDRDVLIVVKMFKKNGINIEVKIDGKASAKTNLPMRNQNWDIKSLHGELVKIKIQHPGIFRLDLIPSEGVSYDEIVKVMDAARETQKNDPKLYILDKETKKQIESRVMFPDVVFANVLEG